MEVPELAFRIACAVLAESVRLIYWFLDDHRTGLDAAGVVRISVVDGYHGHAGHAVAEAVVSKTLELRKCPHDWLPGQQVDHESASLHRVGMIAAGQPGHAVPARILAARA